MATENIIAALDIGTTKITCLVGEMDGDERKYVIGHGRASAEGFRRGVLVDMEKAVRSITKAVKDAELVSGTEIDRVTVGIAGEHIRSINSHGVVAVSRTDNEITRADVNKGIDAARTVAIPVDREIIHVIPQEFSVDDQSGVKDPIGMSGVRLEVQAHIVTASIATARNIHRALDRCGLDADHIVLESLALSESLLTEDEMDVGIAVVDVGGELTQISVFHEGAIRHTAVVSLGGRNVTNDIAIGLRSTVEQAEALKIAQGAAMASLVNPEEMIRIESAAGRESREISRNVLASIIEPRMEEVLSLVIREIRRANIDEMLAGGLVLSGGGSLLPGTIELAEQMLDMPVQPGRIRNFESTPDELNNVCYATAHGLLSYGFGHEPQQMATAGGKVKGVLKRFEKWISKRF